MKNISKDGSYAKKSVVSGIIRFVLLLNIAVFAGMLCGSMLSKYDTGGDLEKINTEVYKSIVSSSLPIIGKVYDNTTGPSGPDNAADSIKSFLTADFYNPVCVMTAQISGLYSYYISVKGEETAGAEIPDNSWGAAQSPGEPEETENSTESTTEKNTAFNDENTDDPRSGSGAAAAEAAISGKAAYIDTYDENSRGMKEAESSISTDNDTEKEGPPAGKVESNGKIAIRNETKNKVDISGLMKEPLKFKFDKKKDKVLIYHTHTTESYIQKISQLNALTPSRSRDPKYSVVRVGEELSEILTKSFKFKVVHNTTVHDYPDFNKSYVNSLKTVTTILKEDPGIKIVIDLHRDAAGNDKKLREVVDINGKKAAKIMFVVATGEVKKNHPGWKENLKLALKLQEKLMEQNPQLVQPIFLSKNTFNQHVSSGALLIEIGGDGNLLEECLESTKYLAKAINDVIIK